MSGAGIRASEIDGSFRPKARATVASVVLDGEAVLLDETSASLHLLNPQASLLWACFDGSATVQELAADIADSFDVDPGDARRDVLAVTVDLGGRGLLDGVEPDVDTTGTATEAGRGEH